MNGATLLLRQVHPSFIQQGRVTSQAFRPTPKDKHKLSMYDGDQIEPEPAFVHYTETLNFASVGVLAVTVAECGELSLPVVTDPLPFPQHVLVDYSAFDKKAVESKAKLLKAKAVTRDWLYGPVSARNL